MTKKESGSGRKEGTKVKKKLFLIVQSILCIALVVLLAASAIGIYRSGLVLKASDPLSWIYSREKAAAALAPALPILVVSLVMTAVGLVTGIRDESAYKGVRDTECLRDLTVARVPVPSTAMARERRLQRRLLCGGWAVFALCMVQVLFYIGDGKHFPNGDLEPVFLALIGYVLPRVALGMAALMISTVLQEKSMQREIEAAKEQIKLEKSSGVQPEAERKEKQTRVNVQTLRVVLLLLAAALIVAGVFNGSARDVFGKAVKLCTECVGLG